MENNELFEMIEKLPPGSKKEVEDLVETPCNKKDAVSTRREFGGLKGFVTYIADDFDAPLKEFHDYMYHIRIEFIEKIEKLSVDKQQEIEALVDGMLEEVKHQNI